MKVYTFIAAEKPAERNIDRSCALLKVSRSAYYEWAAGRPSLRVQADERLRVHVRRIHRDSRGTYGAPRVHEQLRQEGVATARKRVARLMAEDNLQGRQRRRFKKTTIPDAQASAAADLVERESCWQHQRPGTGSRLVRRVTAS